MLGAFYPAQAYPAAGTPVIAVAAGGPPAGVTGLVHPK